MFVIKLNYGYLGDLSELPAIEEIQTAFESKQDLPAKRKSYFFR